MYSEITIKEIDETFDTLDILFLIREHIYKKNNILLDMSDKSIKNDFDVRITPNINPDKLPNIKVHVCYREVSNDKDYRNKYQFR